MQTSVMRAHQWSRVFLLLLVSLIFNTNVSASTVKQVSFDELIEQSELVFEGNVVSAESRWNNSKKLIKTFITFEITEVISGDYQSDTLELSFIGGKIGDSYVEAQGLRQPKVGEKGIYFIQSTTQAMANPLVGWSQGQFLLEQDSTGNEIVMTDSHQPVIGLAETVVDNQLVEASELSKGVAQGVMVMEKISTKQSIMTATDFKSKLKDRIKQISQ